LSKHLNQGIGLDFVDHLKHIFLCVLAVFPKAQFAQVAAQDLLPFHQVRLESLLGKGQTGRHSGYPASDNQSPGDYRHRFQVQGRMALDLGHCRPDQVPGFNRSPFWFSPVHP